MAYLDDHPEMKPIGESFMDAILNRPKGTPVTLPASGWANGLITVNLPGILADQNEMEVWPDEDSSLGNNDTHSAWEAGLIWTDSQAANSVTLCAFSGTIPKIDIPIIIYTNRIAVAR